MNKKAFTLIEILVVISIISMLMAILVPVLAKARGQGKRIVCLSNMRQMYLAASIYVQTYDGYYPIAYYTEDTDSGTRYYCWDFTVVDEPNEAGIIPGILWQTDMMEKVQQCPSFKGSSNTGSDPYTGYNYNTSYIGHGEGEKIPTPAKACQVIRPTECALFGDGQWSGGANKFMRAPFRNPADRTFNARYAGTQGYRHNKKTNVAWCDGHASSQRELYTDIEPGRYQSYIAEGTGFLSPDNSAYDLK